MDPVSGALRWASPITRRVYLVPHPNALWHLDGNQVKSIAHLFKFDFITTDGDLWFMAQLMVSSDSLFIYTPQE